MADMTRSKRRHLGSRSSTPGVRGLHVRESEDRNQCLRATHAVVWEGLRVHIKICDNWKRMGSEAEVDASTRLGLGGPREVPKMSGPHCAGTAGRF